MGGDLSSRISLVFECCPINKWSDIPIPIEYQTKFSYNHLNTGLILNGGLNTGQPFKYLWSKYQTSKSSLFSCFCCSNDHYCKPNYLPLQGNLAKTFRFTKHKYQFFYFGLMTLGCLLSKLCKILSNDIHTIYEGSKLSTLFSDWQIITPNLIKGNTCICR